MITPTELDLYKNEKLQEWLRENMGPTKVGDMVFVGGIIQIILSVETPFSDMEFSVAGWMETPSNYCRLPHPIDPVNPKRGLWGMIDWTNFRLYADGGMWKIFKINEYGHEGWDIGDWVEPTEALLRALIQQIEG